MQEAVFFAERLEESDMGVAALVVNRVHPHFGPDRDEPALRRGRRMRCAGVPPATVRRQSASRCATTTSPTTPSWRTASACELAGVGDRIGAGVVAYVPSLAHDVVDFAALDAVALHLLEPQQSGSGGE